MPLSVRWPWLPTEGEDVLQVEPDYRPFEDSTDSRSIGDCGTCSDGREPEYCPLEISTFSFVDGGDDASPDDGVEGVESSNGEIDSGISAGSEPISTILESGIDAEGDESPESTSAEVQFDNDASECYQDDFDVVACDVASDDADNGLADRTEAVCEPSDLGDNMSSVADACVAELHSSADTTQHYWNDGGWNGESVLDTSDDDSSPSTEPDYTPLEASSDSDWDGEDVSSADQAGDAYDTSEGQPQSEQWIPEEVSIEAEQVEGYEGDGGYDAVNGACVSGS